MCYQSTKIIELGSCAFRQWKADSHCKYIHGYRLQAKFWFGTKELDDKNWVVDFGGLKELKSILETQFDHTLCVAGDDPLLDSFKALHNSGACDLRIMPDGVGIEKTAEWCFRVADNFIRNTTHSRCWVERVEVWEHDKNSAIYIAEQPKKEGCGNKCGRHPKVETEQFELPLNVPADTSHQTTSNSVAAPVSNKTTTGWSNPLGGTSWGL